MQAGDLQRARSLLDAFFVHAQRWAQVAAVGLQQHSNGPFRGVHVCFDSARVFHGGTNHAVQQQLAEQEGQQ